MFESRWTEITKVGSSSKDNDVKNMFKPRCCKKRAKYETMDSKNSSNKKIILFLDDCTIPVKTNMKIILPREQGTCSI